MDVEEIRSHYEKFGPQEVLDSILDLATGHYHKIGKALDRLL